MDPRRQRGLARPRCRCGPAPTAWPRGWTTSCSWAWAGRACSPRCWPAPSRPARGGPRSTCSTRRTPPPSPGWRGECPPERTVHIASSKSGSTLETRSHLEWAWARSRGQGRFAVITDPGSELAALARSRSFAEVFENRPDIGGRYSALSLFGIVPALLSGVDADGLLRGGLAGLAECGPDTAPSTNPGLDPGPFDGQRRRRRPRQAHLPARRCRRHLRPVARAARGRVARQGGHRPGAGGGGAARAAQGLRRRPHLRGPRGDAGRGQHRPGRRGGRGRHRARPARSSGSSRSTSPTWLPRRRPPTWCSPTTTAGSPPPASPICCVGSSPATTSPSRPSSTPTDRTSRRSRTCARPARQAPGGGHPRLRPAVPPLHRPAPQGRTRGDRLRPGARCRRRRDPDPQPARAPARVRRAAGRAGGRRSEGAPGSRSAWPAGSTWAELLEANT